MKNNFKGTKGIWQVQKSGNNPAYNIISTVLGGRYKIARCPYLPDWDPDKLESKANAQLISKAPEMLEILQRMQESYEKDGHLLNFNAGSIAALIKEATDLNPKP